MCNIAFELFQQGEIERFEIGEEAFRKYMESISVEAGQFIKVVERSTKEQRSFLNEIGGLLGHSIEVICDLAFLGSGVERDEAKSKILDLEAIGMVTISPEDSVVELSGGSVERQFLRISTGDEELFIRTKLPVRFPLVEMMAGRFCTLDFGKIKDVKPIWPNRLFPRKLYLKDPSFLVKFLEGYELAQSIDTHQLM